jgi:hypothetical protein
MTQKPWEAPPFWESKEEIAAKKRLRDKHSKFLELRKVQKDLIWTETRLQSYKSNTKKTAKALRAKLEQEEARLNKIKNKLWDELGMGETIRDHTHSRGCHDPQILVSGHLGDGGYWFGHGDKL